MCSRARATPTRTASSSGGSTRFFPPEALHVVTQEELQVRRSLCAGVGRHDENRSRRSLATIAIACARATHQTTKTQKQTPEGQQGALARVVDFLGLCPYNFSTHNLAPIHVTGAHSKPESPSLPFFLPPFRSLSNASGPPPSTGKHSTGKTTALAREPDVERRLRRFYAPHNKRLYELVGRELGWGDDEGDGGGESVQDGRGKEEAEERGEREAQ